MTLVLYYLLLSFGSTLLAVTVGYCLWTKVRVRRLQRDLLYIIAVGLKPRAEKYGARDDPAYQACVDRILALVDLADTLSWATITYLAAETKAIPKIETPNTNLRLALECAYQAVDDRLAIYMTRETVPGVFWWLKTWFVPKDWESDRGKGAAKGSRRRSSGD